MAPAVSSIERRRSWSLDAVTGPPELSFSIFAGLCSRKFGLFIEFKFSARFTIHATEQPAKAVLLPHIYIDVVPLN